MHIEDNLVSQNSAKRADSKSFLTLPKATLFRYFIGFFLCGLMWVMPWSAAIQILLPRRFNLLGVTNTTALVAAVNSVGAIAALLSNIVFGALSDRTRSRLGKRSPFIIGGAFVSGIFLFLTFVMTSPALIIATWAGMQIGLNALLAPFLATLSDRIPKANQGIISAVYGLSFVIGSSAGNYLGALFLRDITGGSLVASICIGAAGFVTSLIWPKEPSTANMPKESLNLKKVLFTFTPPRGKSAKNLYKALFGEMSISCSYYMVNSFILYFFMDYAGLNLTAAQGAIQSMVIPTMIASIIATSLAGIISNRVHGHKSLVLIATAMMSISFIIPWAWPTSSAMILWAVMVGFAYGLYNAMTQALNVSVLPKPQNAGKDLGFLNMSSTTGQVFGSIATSTITGFTESYKPVFPIAIIFTIIAIILISAIKPVR